MASRTRSIRRAAAAVVLPLVAGVGPVATAVATARPAGAAPSDSRTTVDRFFDDLADIETPAEPTLTAIATELDSSGNRVEAARRVLTTQAASDSFVAAAYQRFLGRAPDGGGGAFFAGRLQQGVAEQAVRVDLLGSAERYARSGGTDGGFVDGLYADVLHRSADPTGRAYFVGRLAGGTPRFQVAGEIARSDEAELGLVDDAYRSILRRDADSGGRAFWAGVLHGSAGGERRFLSELAGSGEYAALRAGGGARMVGVDGANNLVTFDALDVDTPISTVPLTGLTASTTIVGLDVRPLTRVLYGIGSDGQLYTIDQTSGTTAKIGAPIGALDASTVGFDFNPVADRIRIVVGARNLRIHPETAAVLGETPDTVQYKAGDANQGQTPVVSGAGYTNSTPDVQAASTVLYDIDSANDRLVIQNPPNSGDLNTVGSLGVDVGSLGGFDITSDGRAHLVGVVGGTQAVLAVDLATGQARELADGGTMLVAATLVPTSPSSAPNAYYVFNNALYGTSLANDGSTPALISVTGLTGNIVGIDIRPATGQLYALNDSGQLYTITVNGAAGTAAAVGTPNADAARSTAGFDFNPSADRIRLLAGTLSFRLNPETGATAGTDTSLTYTDAAGDPEPSAPVPAVNAAAYTNSGRGGKPATTTLFDVDDSRDGLAVQNVQGSPNNGKVRFLGPLGVDLTEVNGFDITTAGVAYGLFTVSGASNLYTVDLTTGTATLVKQVGAAVGYSGFTVR